MSPFKYSFLILVLLSLTGCIATEDKIVDLSGAVFMIFVVLVILKLMTPTIINLSIYKRLTGFIVKHVEYFIYPLYFIAILLLIFGTTLGGIHRVLIFSGFTLAFISYNVSLLSQHNDDSRKKIGIEIISLGFSILFVLFLLWGFGSDLFKGF